MKNNVDSEAKVNNFTQNNSLLFRKELLKQKRANFVKRNEKPTFYCIIKFLLSHATVTVYTVK